MRVFKNVVILLLSTALILSPLTASAANAAITAALTAQVTRNQAEWKQLPTQAPCSGTVDDACAAEAVRVAAAQCSADAKFFRTQTTGWQHLGLALILISAVSTAVGASATIANAKIWSTLGGTTGLGAATTAVNSDISGDQSGLNAITTALAALTKLVTTTPAPKPLAIYQAALLYAGQCDAAANTSSSASPPKS